MEEQFKPKGLLRFYLTWPFLTAIPIACLAVWFYMHRHIRTGTVCVITAVLCIAIALLFYVNARQVFFAEIKRFFSQYETQQLSVMRQTDMPLALALLNGDIVWMNDAFRSYLDPSDLKKPNIRSIAPELNRKQYPTSENETITKSYSYNGKEGDMTLRVNFIDGFPRTSAIMGIGDSVSEFLSVTLNDLSDLHRTLREKDDRQIAAGLLYIDNYDELIDNIEEFRQSMITALIEQEINHYVIEHNGLLKKTENDKYFFAVCKRDLADMKADKFEILETAKKIETGIGRRATISIGIGLANSSYTESSDFARSAISLALARGGDQVVIKDDEGTTYFGGKAEQSSKTTRVKARVKAHDLCELLMQKNSIFIMGHTLPDADSLGSAIGIWKIAHSLEREAHIIIGRISANLRPLYQAFCDSPDYPDNLFISPSQALDMARSDSMVIVVDTNIPARVESEKLLSVAGTIVVFDHHRQNVSPIENPTLSYIEPYASSASEMITEVIQYTDTPLKLTPLEANALYAGIVIDTNHFVNRTGVRTFEAASYLRRAGADVTYVRKKFRDDIESYKEKALIVSRAQVYRDRFAIATYDGEVGNSPTILGAQAANELLGIDGIQASFVLTRYSGGIYVSARSIDEVNVQIIMEKLGGGGHINIAGAQFDHDNMKEAVNTLKSVLDRMITDDNL